MEMKDCSYGAEDGPTTTSYPEDKKGEKRYPEISFGDKASWSAIAIDGELEAGSKVVVKLICKVKEVTEQSVSTDGKKEESCRGTLLVLEAGAKPYDEGEMRKMGREKISNRIEETLESE